MTPWKTDTAVLLIFFVRDNTFRQVFESVRAARPRILLLWQDGPRENRPDDRVGIQACREIAESIDWDCEVHRMYHDKNMGCDPSTFYAMRWAFTIVDKCIILEDDQVPSPSFYPYCVELLDRYENDDRISHICGYNIFGTAEWCDNDYLFAYNGSGAWASWRRVAQCWDSEYNFMKDEASLHSLQKHYGKFCRSWLKSARWHSVSGKAYWETIVGFSAALNSRYAIIPKYNLVQNMGISKNATHSSISDLSILPRKYRQIYASCQHDLKESLVHPKYVVPDMEYMEKLFSYTKRNILTKWIDRIEMTINVFRKGKMKYFMSMILTKLIRK